MTPYLLRPSGEGMGLQCRAGRRMRDASTWWSMSLLRRILRTASFSSWVGLAMVVLGTSLAGVNGYGQFSPAVAPGHDPTKAFTPDLKGAGKPRPPDGQPQIQGLYPEEFGNKGVRY